MKIFRKYAPLFLLFFLFSFPAAGQETSRDLYQKGREALFLDDPYQASAVLREALRLNEAYADARLALAEAYFRLGEYEESLKEIEKTKPYAQGRRELILLEARVFTAFQRYQEAQDLYQVILAARPYDPEANRGLAELQAILGHSQEAVNVYDLALRYDPGDRRVLLQLVILHDEAGDRALAEGALMEVIRRYAKDPLTRLQAAEHYAFYQEWEEAGFHLDQARVMITREQTALYHRLSLLSAKIDMQRGAPDRALEHLAEIPETEEREALFLEARALRALGEEESAQLRLARILRQTPDDEITRIFQEDPLVRSYSGFAPQRQEAADYYLEAGKKEEAAFSYDRALRSYRRARILAKDYIPAWTAYADLVRKMGFSDKYRDLLSSLLLDIPGENPAHAQLLERQELLEHSRIQDLALEWGIEDPWNLPREVWSLSLFVLNRASRLPEHEGAEHSLGQFLAYALENETNLRVNALSEGEPGPYQPPEVGLVSHFGEAFQQSRGTADYFLLLSFTETSRAFECQADLYLARTGELVMQSRKNFSGKGRVKEVFHRIVQEISQMIPPRGRLLGVEGNRLLLDQGRWHGTAEDQKWLVLKQGTGKASLAPGGISFHQDDLLGTLTIQRLDESLAEAGMERAGSFDFFSLNDQAFFIEPLELPPSSPLPASVSSLKSRLLSIP